MNIKLVYITLFFSIISFLAHAQKQPKKGIWRGVLLLNVEKNRELPFNFEIKKVGEKSQIIIHNALERITVTEVISKKDSFNFKMPVFDSEFLCQLVGDTLLKGLWINHAKKENNIVPFTAVYGNSKRFLFLPGKSNPVYEGKWEVTFSPQAKDSSKAVGVFTHPNGSSYVTGTFLTETGDYRYLEGMMHNGSLYLSCFDGSHAFLFTAENNGTEITNGHFYSGAAWEEPWIGKRNAAYKLKDPEAITKLKTDTSQVELSFNNVLDKKVTLNDIRYKNKPVIIQIMGTWCPNCMDETAYLAGLYNTYSKQGLEIIALTYERALDINKIKKNIQRLKTKFDARYEILITGLTGKEKATESLPFLNAITSFPTLIVLDKNHHVKTIYAGFNGPATGVEYNAFTTKFENLIKELIK
jgi:thiol-disulfide isomerase/thioredoxin